MIAGSTNAKGVIGIQRQFAARSSITPDSHKVCSSSIVIPCIELSCRQLSRGLNSFETEW